MESFSMKAEGGTSLSPSGFQEVDPNTAVGKTPAKIGTHEPFLNVPVHSTFARSSDASSDLSLYSADNDNERSAERLLPALRGYRLDSRSPTPNVSWKAKGLQLWAKNKGLVLVILSQLFGVMMNVTTRLLEMDGKHGPGMHPFQILVARMSGTLILSGIYQWLAKVEHAPFGPREVWKLLVARGVGGFFGVYGMYYSLEYLPLSDATVITFLAPIVACWASSIFLHEPFTRAEQIAALISFLGVILIARPTSLIPGGFDPSISGDGAADVLPSTNATLSGDPQGLHNVTSAQRLGAIGVALTGVLGAACAYSTIRWIGKRAHPLISVNYFAFWAAFVSTIGLLVLPGVGFQLPASPRQWVYLIFLGLCGFGKRLLDSLHCASASKGFDERIPP